MSPVPVAYKDVWSAIKTRLLNSVDLSVALGGANRIYLEGNHPERPEGTTEDGFWGRVILMSQSALWDTTDTRDKTIAFGLAVKVEFNNYRNQGYDANISLDAAHLQINRYLQGWTIPKTTTVMGALPFFLYRGQDPMPLYDSARDLFFKTAFYRCELHHGTVVLVSPDLE